MGQVVVVIVVGNDCVEDVGGVCYFLKFMFSLLARDY